MFPFSSKATLLKKSNAVLGLYSVPTLGTLTVANVLSSLITTLSKKSCCSCMLSLIYLKVLNRYLFTTVSSTSVLLSTGVKKLPPTLGPKPLFALYSDTSYSLNIYVNLTGSKVN